MSHVHSQGNDVATLLFVGHLVEDASAGETVVHFWPLFRVNHGDGVQGQDPGEPRAAIMFVVLFRDAYHLGAIWRVQVGDPFL